MLRNSRLGDTNRRPLLRRQSRQFLRAGSKRWCSRWPKPGSCRASRAVAPGRSWADNRTGRAVGKAAADRVAAGKAAADRVAAGMAAAGWVVDTDCPRR